MPSITSKDSIEERPNIPARGSGEIYNEEQKSRFIASLVTKSEKCIKLYHSLFRSTGYFEKEVGKDLCTMSSSELQRVVDWAAGMCTASKRLLRRVIDSYLEWCIKEGIPGAVSHIDEVSISGIDQLLEQTVAGPRHLAAKLDLLFPHIDPFQFIKPTQDGGFSLRILPTINVLYRCYYWLAFAGMQESDIFRVKCSDVDFATMTIHYGGAEYPIYREALSTFHVCVETDEFYVYHKYYKEPIQKPRAPGDLLIRGLNPSYSVGPFRSKISAACTKASSGGIHIRLTYSRIWISGMFYRIYEDETAGLPMDFTKIARIRHEDKPYNLSKSRNTPEAKYRELGWLYKKDYERWKKAHYQFLQK